MRSQTRRNTSRLWILVIAFLFMVSLPAVAGVQPAPGGAGPAGNPGGGPASLGGPPGNGGGENNSGDPDDWGIDFQPPPGHKDAKGIQSEQLPQSTAGSGAEWVLHNPFLTAVLMNLWYLSR
jgi:hypothetical protein